MNDEAGVLLSTNLNVEQAVPYFLWDEPMTVVEFRQRLQTASPAEATRLLTKLLREARDTDVWHFVSPAEVWRRWPAWRLNWAAAAASGCFS